MRHFQFLHFTETSDDPYAIIVGCECILNGRRICAVAKSIRTPVLHMELAALSEAIEDEVRDTVDRMDPEVLL